MSTSDLPTRVASLGNALVLTLLWAWLVAVAAWMHLVHFSSMLEWDAHVFVLLGKWLTFGVIPYRDVFEVKPPGIFLYLGALFAAYPAIWVVRFADVAWTLLGAWAMVRLLVPSAGRIAAVAATTAWIAWQRDYGFTYSGVYTEQYASAAGLAALACTHPVVSGILLAVATLFKHPGALVIVPIVILRVGQWRVRDWARFVIAAAVPLGLVALFFAAAGAWDDFLYCNVWALFQHSHRGPQPDLAQRWPIFVERTLEIASTRPLMIVSLALGTGLALFVPSRLAVAALCWGVLNLAAVPLVGHFFPHHYVMMFPSIALLGGAVLGHFISPQATDALPRRFARGLLAVALLVGAYEHLRPSLDEERPLIASELARLREGPAAWTSGPGRPIEETAGLYIRDHSLPTDRIHVHGWHGTALSVYWYADRLPAIQYFYEIPFHLDPRRQLEALQDARPRFVVLIHTPDDRPIRAWLASGYQLEHTDWLDYKLEVWGRLDP